MPIHAWDEVVMMESLISKGIDALRRGTVAEAPGLPGWFIVIPWSMVDQYMTMKRQGVDVDSMDDHELTVNQDGTKARVCIGRWVKNNWIEIAPQGMFSEDGMTSMFIFIIMRYPNMTPNQNSREGVVLVAGGSGSVTLEDLQEDLIKACGTDNYEELVDRYGDLDASHDGTGDAE